MMNIKDWEVDITNLVGPHKGKFDYSFEHYFYELYESPEKNIACLIYDVVEISLGWEVGFLAVFKNKKDPKLIINPKDFLCFYVNDTVQFGKGGTIIFIKKLVNTKNKNFEIPLCIVDLESFRFTYFSIINSTPYKVVQNNSNTEMFKLVEKYRDDRFDSYDGHVINLENKKWSHVKELDKFDELYYSKVLE